MENDASEKICVTINGQQRQLEPGLSVLELIDLLEVRNPAIAVERNSKICSQDEFAITPVDDGDEFEIVSLVGGG